MFVPTYYEEVEMWCFSFYWGVFQSGSHTMPPRYLSKVSAVGFTEKPQSIMVTKEMERDLHKKKLGGRAD